MSLSLSSPASAPAPDFDKQRLMLELELHQTELELQNQELQAAWQKADQRAHSLELAVKELESFSYAVSHDLRAPLRHINGYLSILAHDFESHLPAEARRLLERSREATRDMGRLIDDLLDLAKVSRIKINSKMVNVSHLAHAAIDRLLEGEPNRKVDVVIAEGLFVQGGQALLSQLMWNLLENAWKYTSTTAAAKIEVGRLIVDDRLIIFVKDNGVGFDSSYKEKLFEAFQRLHGREFEGNGIGLATVRRVIERHQGKIWAESEKGEGAIFFFTLP
ncbi:GHKL domain-containing protein [Geomonas oryzisoli]|uniref:histidine kinase n=1 Tax=Geomonas oryzisoli TaxID=2847992 RepID=A0ABX8J4R4_9BACT|nr:ATP-binding protein [Geomonas oryzisoli]QWV93443.1 GHKL domain-containing protein [Geomonas oryzisoli]